MKAIFSHDLDEFRALYAAAKRDIADRASARKRRAAEQSASYKQSKSSRADAGTNDKAPSVLVLARHNGKRFNSDFPANIEKTDTPTRPTAYAIAAKQHTHQLKQELSQL